MLSIFLFPKIVPSASRKHVVEGTNALILLACLIGDMVLGVVIYASI